MTVVPAKIRQQLIDLPTIRAGQRLDLIAEIRPNRHRLDPGDLKVDTEFQGLPSRVPLRVYVSPRLRDTFAEPPYPYEDNRVQVVRFNTIRQCWEFGSKPDFRAAFDAAEQAGLWERDAGPAGDVVEDRTLHLHDVTQQQFYGLRVAMDLPRGQLGRFKGTPGERREITLDDDSCMGQLDQAIAYADRLGIGYELHVTTVRSSPARDTSEQPPAWSQIYLGGCWIYYTGGEPTAFAEAIAAEFGFDPSVQDGWESPIGHGFQCPAEHLDAIYGSGRWPLVVM